LTPQTKNKVDIFVCLINNGIMSGRIFCIGDVHGCYRELMQLLEKVKYQEGTDVLIFAGDLVDRGPQSAEVVRWVREAHARTYGKVIGVMGNHDEKHFRYFKHVLRKRAYPNYNFPMRPFSTEKLITFNSMSEDDLEFLGKLPTFIHLKTQDWVVVHAGLEPQKDLEEQDDGRMIHMRYLDPNTLKTVSLNENYLPPVGSIYWTECYNLPYHVVYGHNVHSLYAPMVTKRPNGAQLVGLDTGCCFGGALTAFLVPATKDEQVTPDHFVSVSATKAYSRSVLSTKE
jgi:hypothetical protein